MYLYNLWVEPWCNERKYIVPSFYLCFCIGICLWSVHFFKLLSAPLQTSDINRGLGISCTMLMCVQRGYFE